uniref:AAA family ATPase n=1 Tax=Thaumasiovibrio occultus TaxID=1891184 RepID=UPI000B357479|nr:AAA family ATPase [Thaumasiovibrio occultus]
MTIIKKAVVKHRQYAKAHLLNQGGGGETSEATQDRDDNVHYSLVAVAPRQTNPVIEIGSDAFANFDFVSGGHSFGHSEIIDEYRIIKNRVLWHIDQADPAISQHQNLLMVSSANKGEGKTFTAVNLALSLATEAERTVLLIDADCVSRDLTQSVSMSDAPGLINYLSGDVRDISNILHPTTIPNLKLIPAGDRHMLSSELLNSQRMEAFTRELAERYDDRIIIFDTPPVLQSFESIALSKSVGQALFVVERFKTRTRDVERAIQSLSQHLKVGVVINKAKSERLRG